MLLISGDDPPKVYQNSQVGLWSLADLVFS